MSDMSLAVGKGLIEEARTARAGAGVGRRACTLLRKQPLGAVGLVLILLVVAAALLAPWITHYGPLDISGVPLSKPSGAHWFGTDDLGRDVFSRVLYGARVSLIVGFFSVLLGCTAGAIVGLFSGFEGGWVDILLQRVIDAMMAFPTLVLALAIVAALGAKERNVIFAIAFAMVPSVSRVTRGSVLAIKQEQYVEAARAIGCRNRSIMARHVLPNIVAPLIVVATASFGGAIVAEAALSFVGLGIPIPHPSWGNMMSGPARTFITRAPWMALFPGLALSLLVFGVNLLGDSLRDILDPRLRQR